MTTLRQLVLDGDTNSQDMFGEVENNNISSIFVRNKADISELNEPYYSAAGFEEQARRLKYLAFKSITLYGFDSSKDHKVRALWVDSYGNGTYRLIISEKTDETWANAYDTGSMVGYAVEGGKIHTLDITVGGKRVVAEIDFTYLLSDDSSILSNNGTGENYEPEFIISKTCFVGADNDVIANSITIDDVKISSPITQSAQTRPYYNSRRKPTIVFIWDDTLDTDQDILDIFAEFGYTCGFALNTGNLNAENANRYRQAYYDGHSILAHSINSTPMSDAGAITYAQVDLNMLESKKTIEDYGIRVSGWVTPSSALDISFFPLMEKNFGYGFTNLNAGGYDENVDPLKVSRYSLENNIDDDTHSWSVVEARIDLAITNNELLVFYAHGIPSAYYDDIHGNPRVNETDLRALLTFLKTRTEDNLCQVLAPDEAVSQYYKTLLF